MNKIDFKSYVELTDEQRHYQVEITKNYKKFALDPKNSNPMFIINTPVASKYTYPEMLADPSKMLETGLDKIKAHLEVGDDYVPALRVEFGTGQVSHAYGCGVYVSDDSPPCASTHILNDIEQVASLGKPSLQAGWFSKLEQFNQFFKENAPDFIQMQIPDIQGAFNNAHLLRGNDILYDFYDYPDEVELLLEKMTDYLIDLTKHMNDICNMDGEHFCDWGALWRGSVRISNCSLHMISTDFFKDFIKKHDQRLINTVGGGRIHYCGTHDDGLFEQFFSMENIYGVDYDGTYHNFWDLAPRTPLHITLLQYTSREQAERLISGDWPNKRNLIISVYASSLEEGKELLRRLRESVPQK